MPVIITESDMQFGKYGERQVFQLENSRQYTEKLMQDGIKSCEFILRKQNGLHPFRMFFRRCFGTN
ncbi:hypothetical protein V1226_16735 [Lachnospiraceae bacterium JLR.KK009]